MNVEKLERWIAEKIEPEPEFNSGSVTSGVIHAKSRIAWEYYGEDGQWEPRRFASDAIASKMLREKLAERGSVHLVLYANKPNPTLDEPRARCSLYRAGKMVVNSEGKTEELAVALAFALAHGARKEDFDD